ncbi:MAG: hypothetical protein Ct9H90mP26_2800 [Methanobacteriota archaeon]|nr:MAG: hypothetical protein Ct9H90mP26_2800 [Euryarchaeota archaeon]
MCNQSIPASFASSRVSPNLQKSAVRILGVSAYFLSIGKGGGSQYLLNVSTPTHMLIGCIDWENNGQGC